MSKVDGSKIRNVALLSHSGAGKTVITESALVEAKMVSRFGTITDGNTVSDYEPEEHKRQASVQTSIVSCVWNDHKINFIVADYRGYGLSSGSPSKDNLHSDSNKIFSYVRKSLEENNYNRKMIIMGRSLGSASACEIISNHEKKIDGCIIESGFGTELPLMRILALSPSDVEYNPKDGFENLRKLVSYSKPILIIHADRDDIIPIDEARIMHKEVGSEKRY